jgi:hypothetical protein
MRPQPSADDQWVTGDHFRLPIPADPAALRAGGAAFLTEAFRVSGALTRKDPLIKDDESVRAPLQMLTNALSLWEIRHFGGLLDAALG